MNYKWVLWVWFVLTSCLAGGQNAPVTAIGSVTGSISAPVIVPVNITNFNNIGAITLTLDYYYPSIHFIQGIPHPLLSTLEYGESDLGNGYHRITIAWYGTGVTLPDGSSIINLTFDYINGESTLQWFDNGGSCEYADEFANVLNDIPFSDYYLDGNVCGEIGTPGSISGLDGVCQGQTSIIYSIPPIINTTMYNWTVSPGAIIVNGNGTNMIYVDYPSNSLSGPISVHGINTCGDGPITTMQITVNPLPLANAENDTTIPYGTNTILHAETPGPGTYTYHWSPESFVINPNVQNPQTTNLIVTTLFTVIVTNLATDCSDFDEKVVSISGGPLNINPIANPGSTCRGDMVQLYANAGGGSGNYSYLWTCLPASSPIWTSSLANPVVSPDSSTIYNLTVSDNFNVVSESTFLLVNQLPTLTLSGGDTICGEGATAFLYFNLTGVPPWNFSYINGATVYTVLNQITTPLIIEVTHQGIYFPFNVSDAYCDGSTYGIAVVIVNPVPAAPIIVQNGDILESNISQGNQWYLNGSPIPEATGAIYTPLASGNYYDIVTFNSCSSSPSNNLYFVFTEMKDSRFINFLVSPNPSNGIIQISNFKAGEEKLEILLISTEGRIIRNLNYILIPGRNNLIIDLQNIIPGIYILVINSNNEKIIRKLIIQ